MIEVWEFITTLLGPQIREAFFIFFSFLCLILWSLLVDQGFSLPDLFLGAFWLRFFSIFPTNQSQINFWWWW
jgi:hypothetical protein